MPLWRAQFPLNWNYQLLLKCIFACNLLRAIDDNLLYIYTYIITLFMYYMILHVDYKYTIFLFSLLKKNAEL